mmetsp:Transcript_30978/g.34662  ORF Transcript_30978/g.34662 Transcript_30978/m.34662 type:complete len:207 (+) Transcript_30978:1428-2048(+)
MASLRMLLLDPPPISSMYDRITFTALITTAEFACCNRGVTRSMIPSASRPSAGVYLERESKIKTCPHSVHSFNAANSFCNTAADTFITSRPDDSAISDNAATALATTLGFESLMRSCNVSRKPRSATNSGAISYNLATQTAAVLRTYGSSSRNARFNGSHKYSVIRSTLIQPIVRTANARINGLASAESLTNVFTASRVNSGCVFA